MSRRIARIAVIAAIVALATTGCTSNPVASKFTVAPTPSETVAPAPSATVTTPPPTQNPHTASAVRIACSTLVPDSVMAQFLPNLTPVSDYVPADGSDIAKLAALDGSVCEWTGGGHSVQVAVAKPSAKDLLALKDDLVERSNSVPTYGEEAYFQVVRNIGEADAFHGKYWIVTTSSEFYEPGDASVIVQAVGAALDGKTKAAEPQPSDSATPN